MSRIVIYGCGPDEATVFREMAPRVGVVPIIIEAPVSEENSGLAAGSRCISVGHKTRLTKPVLRALSRVGVEYVSTRSVGLDHIDTGFAERIGIAVGTVEYAPDSVADYTLLLMLMASFWTTVATRRSRWTWCCPFCTGGTARTARTARTA